MCTEATDAWGAHRGACTILQEVIVMSSEFTTRERHNFFDVTTWNGKMVVVHESMHVAPKKNPLWHQRENPLCHSRRFCCIGELCSISVKLRSDPLNRNIVGYV